MVACLKIESKEGIQNVDDKLMVHISTKRVNRTAFRCSVLTNNYCKGSSGIFQENAKDVHPGSLLLRVKDIIDNK